MKFLPLILAAGLLAGTASFAAASSAANGVASLMAGSNSPAQAGYLPGQDIYSHGDDHHGDDHDGHHDGDHD